MGIRKWCYILPFQIVIKICLKHELELMRLLKYNRRIDYWVNSHEPEEYVPDKIGKMYDVDYFMGQEFLFIDDEFTKSKRIEKLEAELKRIKQ